VWLWIVLGLCLAALCILFVTVLALLRHLKLLGGSLKRLGEELRPQLEELRSGSDRAREQVDGIEERRSSLRPGARIRR
jgi:hypothetical protein